MAISWPIWNEFDGLSSVPNGQVSSTTIATISLLAVLSREANDRTRATELSSHALKVIPPSKSWRIGGREGGEEGSAVWENCIATACCVVVYVSYHPIYASEFCITQEDDPRMPGEADDLKRDRDIDMLGEGEQQAIWLECNLIHWSVEKETFMLQCYQSACFMSTESITKKIESKVLCKY